MRAVDDKSKAPQMKDINVECTSKEVRFELKWELGVKGWEGLG